MEPRLNWWRRCGSGVWRVSGVTWVPWLRPIFRKTGVSSAVVATRSELFGRVIWRELLCTERRVAYYFSLQRIKDFPVRDLVPSWVCCQSFARAVTRPSPFSTPLSPSQIQLGVLGEDCELASGSEQSPDAKPSIAHLDCKPTWLVATGVNRAVIIGNTGGSRRLGWGRGVWREYPITWEVFGEGARLSPWKNASFAWNGMFWWILSIMQAILCLKFWNVTKSGGTICISVPTPNYRLLVLLSRHDFRQLVAEILITLHRWIIHFLQSARCVSKFATSVLQTFEIGYICAWNAAHVSNLSCVT